MDGDTWSNFLPADRLDISVASLSPGAHRLEARARDADGLVDHEPASLDFTVADTPLQDTPAFPYLVAGILALIAALVWISQNRARLALRANAALMREVERHEQTGSELQTTNEQLLLARDELEQRVAERTAELTAANEALRTALREREEASRRQAALEQQLRDAQKLEAVGTLAGGIAHDINNILTIIIPCANLAIEETADRPSVREYLNHVLKAADRAKHLVKQILTFSKRQRPEQRVIDLAPIVRETVDLLRSALPATVTLTARIDAGAPPVFADPHQIHQVLMNLCTNAHQALPDARGNIGITPAPVHVATLADGVSSAPDEPGLLPGDHVSLSVADDGAGIPDAIQSRIFEPFFTTKSPQQGTGLGLAVVHGIVRDHGGVIRLRSAPGRGSVFEILLPARSSAPVPSARPFGPVLGGRGERILLVDDEAVVVSVLAAVLMRQGYEVVAHAGALAALEAFRAQPEAFHLLITDFTMPAMTGHELAREVLAVRPDLPVVLITGFGETATVDTARAIGIRQVLHKPFDAQDLVALVQNILPPAAPKPPAA